MAAGFNPIENFGKPAPKKKVTKKAPAPSAADRAVVKAARTVGTTTKKAAPQVTRAVRRTVATTPKPTGSPYQSTLDIIEKATRSGPKPKAADPKLQTGGLNDLQRYLGATGGGRTIGGFLTNLGAGAVRTITDLPAGAQLLGEAALYPVVKATNMVQQGGGGSGPRRGAYLQGAEDKISGDMKRAKEGVVADYRHRYGPLLEGDVGKFASRFYDDPTPTILDVAGAYSSIGRAPAATARGAAALTTGRLSQDLAKLGSRSRLAPGQIDVVTGAVSKTGGRLYRPPRRVIGRATGETPKGNINAGSRVIEVPRRPYSPNIITRAGQRTADRVRAKVTPRIERYAESRQPIPGQEGSAKATALRPLTAQGKFDRAVSSQTRDLIFRREQRAAGTAGRDAAPYVQALRKLKPDKNEAGVRVKGISTEQIATRLHLEDVLSERGGLTPVQLRDRVVARMEQGIKTAEARGERTDLTRLQVEKIKAIPDSLLDLRDMSDPQVARVAAAVEAGRKLDEISQARSVAGKVITPAKAAEMRSRTSSLLLGGSEWAPALLKEMRRAGVPKAERAAVRAGAIVDNPKLAKMRTRLAGLDDKIAASRLEGKVATAAKAEEKRSAYLKSVRAAEDRALGFTTPTRPELVGSRGVYIPKKPVDRLSLGSSFPRRKGFSGPTRPKQDTGYLTQKGGFDMNPELLAHQAKRAADAEVGPMSNAALNELIGIAAYLDDKGKMVSGKRALEMARTDPDRVVLVHRGRLRDALAKLDDLEEGKHLDPSEVKLFFGDGKESWLQAIPDGPDTGQYVAISKAAADVWRDAPTTSPILKGADRVLDYWKGGILALSPRWYANSTIGIATQYGLLAGGDIRSLRQAIRKGPIKDAIPDEVVLNSLANDVGFKGAIDANKMERVFAAGFRANNRMESAWRRAAYINRAKKALRDEGKRFRGLTDQEIAHAIDNMPPSIARNVIRDVDLFMGEFRKFNSFERNVVKRVIPFYSWLRVISRLTFSLPYRSPVRAAALATLARAGEYGINPEDYARPIYERGALVFGKYRVPTAGLNSPATLTGAIQAATRIASDPGSALGQIGEEAVGWARPELQTGLAATYGTTSFGNPVIAPTGYGGTVRGFGGTKGIDPSTGRVESQRQRIPFDEAIFQNFGGAPAQAIRKALSGGERPFDTTRTLALALARLEGGSTKGMFLDPAKDSYKQSVGWGLGSALGINPHTEDAKKLISRYEKAKREFEQARRRAERQNR